MDEISGGEADWAQPPLLKILSVGRLVGIVVVREFLPVLDYVSPAFSCGGNMGFTVGTVGVASASEEVDATFFIVLVEHGLGDIGKEEVLLLDDVLEELHAALDLLDIVLVEGELTRLGCGVSYLSPPSPSSYSSSAPLLLMWGWGKYFLDCWRESVAEGLSHDVALDVVRVQDEVPGHV